MTSSAPARPSARLEAMARARTDAGRAFFEAEAERVARLCQAMAERFSAGGRLLAVGGSPTARSDARHVAVEFVHPVIVGKRALPAVGLTPDGGSLAGQLDLTAEAGDIVIAFGSGEETSESATVIDIARRRGCLTVAFAPDGADWIFEPPGDAFVRQELTETLYHVLWELVHVFLDHRGMTEAGSGSSPRGAGASGFLYPFLEAQPEQPDALVADVRASVLSKALETASLRRHVLTGEPAPLLAAAAALRARLRAGGRLLALGNGGSATDAMDAVADFRSPLGAHAPHRALDLTEDTAILTAVANDIGTEALYARQVIAHGRPGDALLAFSTSGGSDNVLSALAEARRRSMLTIAMLGYDGGQIAAEALADHVIVAPSQNIPRIQEAHASASHALRELVEMEPEEGLS